MSQPLKNAMLDRLRRGEVLLGFANSYPAPAVIEGMCRGCDFVWIDGQHGQLSYDSALAAVRTAQAIGCEVLLRVPGHEPGFLGPYADMAPALLMVPMVDTPEQAEAIVRATRFPPLGNRSYGGRRPIDLEGRDFYRMTEVGITAQIETPEAVTNAAAIAQVPGVDVLFFSPDDMKLRLGLPVETPVDSPQLRPGMEVVAKAARAAGKFAGCVAPTAAMVAQAVSMGYQVLGGGGDAGFIRSVAPAKLKELRQAIAGVAAPAAAGGEKPKSGSVYG